MRMVSALLAALWLGGCGIQSIPQGVNEVEATWAEVLNQYKRRADLVPNLVKTVKGYAAHESDTLTAVVEARAKATQTQVNLANLDATTMQKFEKAQTGLSSALGKLMVVVERYPDLKANENMLALQEELTSTENKVAFARQAFNDSVLSYNNTREVFPGNIIAGWFQFKAAEYLEIESDSKREVPAVSFSK